MTCPVCDSYWAALNVTIDKAGLVHHEAMRTIRSVEADSVPSRAVVMSPLIDVRPTLLREAEETAVALGF